MTFPIARLDLTAAGGAFYTDYAVDYYSDADPYNEIEDNLPLRNITRRTSRIAQSVDDIIDFLDDAINGSTIRGLSDSGHSDPSDNVDTLEKFLSESHNADGTLKRTALGELHPPVTPASGNYPGLRVFVGSQRIKLDAGIGDSKVAAGNDARFAFFDAVVAEDGTQSRVNAPETSPPAPYTYYKKTPHIQGLTYYTTLKAAVDAGAQRVLILGASIDDPGLTGAIDLGGKELFVYGLDDSTVSLNIPAAGVTFSNSPRVTFKNIQINAISGTPGVTFNVDEFVIESIKSSINLTVQNAIVDINYFEHTEPFTVDTCTGDISNLKSTEDIILKDCVRLNVSNVLQTAGILYLDSLQYCVFNKLHTDDILLDGGVSSSTFNAVYCLNFSNPDGKGLSYIDFNGSFIQTISNTNGTWYYLTFNTCGIQSFIHNSIIPAPPHNFTFESCDIDMLWFETEVNQVSINSSDITQLTALVANYYEISDSYIGNLAFGLLSYGTLEACKIGDSSNSVFNYVTMDGCEFVSATSLWDITHVTMKGCVFDSTLSINSISNVVFSNNYFTDDVSFADAEFFRSESNNYAVSTDIVFSGTSYYSLHFEDDDFDGDISFTGDDAQIDVFIIQSCRLNSNRIGNVTSGDFLDIAWFVVRDVSDLNYIDFTGDATGCTVSHFMIEDSGFTVAAGESPLTLSNLDALDYFTLRNVSISDAVGSNDIAIIGITGSAVEFSNIRVERTATENGNIKIEFNGMTSIANYEFTYNYQLPLEVYPNQTALVDARNIYNGNVAFNILCNFTYTLDNLTAGGNISVYDTHFSNNNFGNAFSYGLKIKTNTNSSVAYVIHDIVFESNQGTFDISDTNSPIIIDIASGIADENACYFGMVITDCSYRCNLAAGAGGYHAFVARIIGADQILNLDMSVLDVRVKQGNDATGLNTCFVYHDTQIPAVGVGFMTGIIDGCSIQRYKEPASGGSWNRGTFTFAGWVGGNNAFRRFAGGYKTAAGFNIEYAESLGSGVAMNSFTNYEL